jgi:hypothetical protein
MSFTVARRRANGLQRTGARRVGHGQDTHRFRERKAATSANKTVHPRPNRGVIPSELIDTIPTFGPRPFLVTCQRGGSMPDRELTREGRQAPRSSTRARLAAGSDEGRNE